MKTVALEEVALDLQDGLARHGMSTAHEALLGVGRTGKKRVDRDPGTLSALGDAS
jgi:hypothetical protein